MATAYHVFDGVIGSKTTLDNIKKAGAKNASEINVKNRHAVGYQMGGPDAPICAVLIYEAEGDNFTGQSL